MAQFRVLRSFLLLSLIVLAAPLAFGQQVGSISGRVTSSDGQALPGVTVEARSTVLPQPRVTTSIDEGEYRLAQLPPGLYTLTFSLAGLQTATREVRVLLNQDTPVSATLAVEGVSESITVTADATLVDPSSTEIKSALPESVIEELPLGQEYRDLMKLAPSVQYSEDAIRGPSAGGSGQDNVYHFDGVNVTLPLFGTLSAEPSSHDISEISVIKGGAKATDFNRAAGFLIDSVSKSGTSEWKGELQLQLQPESLRGEPIQLAQQFDQSRSWATFSLGGPLLRDRLFVYGSYYRPVVERTNRSNAYGALPDYESTRNEYFGKLTYTPTQAILLHGSYRTSTREVSNSSIGTATTPATPSTAIDDEAGQDIAILEGSWVVSPRSYVTFKFTDYANETASTPQTIVNSSPTTTPGTRIDINNLQQFGLFTVPSLRPDTPANANFNNFVRPIIDRYGFLNSAGVRTGGGEVGAGSQFNENDFYRTLWQVGYDFTLGSRINHDIHVGYQFFKDAEDLRRQSNGWGGISVPAGTVTFQGQPVFYQAQFIRSVTGGQGNNIHSEYQSHNIEVNDTIRWNNWTFNAGLVVSNDTLYGQGLREDDSTLSGYVVQVGSKYEMYEIPWEKTLQPRIGATWAYNGFDNVYASYARYVPAASSLPRAAAWDRSVLGLTTRLHFDAAGTLIGAEPVSSSTGKLFADDLDPRHTDEYLIGTSQQVNQRWTARAYARYRYSTNFWEDLENDTYQRLAPAAGLPQGNLIIPDLIQRLNQLGISNATNRAYVIAALDGAFTKHYEVTLESDWRGNRTFLRGSYTWGHYYGNFDQDNTSLDFNDSSIFIGSSALADGAGRQIWDNKYGDLRGDRRHLLKIYGSYQLPWNASVGAFGLYQSGQPWEAWNYEIYRQVPGFGTSTSDQARYGEPAGSRRMPSHYQVDLNYTQTVPIAGFNLAFIVDAFNITDRQTGYNFEPSVHRTTTVVKFGEPRDYFDPRRYQVALRLEF